MEIVNPSIETYVEACTTNESDAARALVQTSEYELQYTDMISGKIVGKLLAMLVKISGAKRILEIGTFTGYSALRIAEALPEDGSIITCDMNERYEAIAREQFAKSGLEDKIMLKMGSALQTLKTLSGPFDLIFLDADKRNYPEYGCRLIPMLPSGGLLVIDNVLWGGEVLDPKDDKSQAIDACNRMIADDERIEQVMLPVRDGITIARRIQ